MSKTRKTNQITSSSQLKNKAKPIQSFLKYLLTKTYLMEIEVPEAADHTTYVEVICIDFFV